MLVDACSRILTPLRLGSSMGKGISSSGMSGFAWSLSLPDVHSIA